MKCRCGNISDDETCANCLRMEIEYKICDKCRSHYPKNDVCVCMKGNISNPTNINWWCCSADFGKHDPTCKHYKEYMQEISSKLVKALDNSKMGRFGFNKCTTLNDKKEEIWLTIYDTSNRQDGFDEQLSFRPEELIEFCREVIRISEQ